MQKIIVIGCPGSGKSTFAKALHKKTGIPLYHLDMLYWNSNKTTVEKEVFAERLSGVLKQDRWIIDGNYASTLEMRTAACDTVFFLDYPTEVCLEGILSRQGKPRSDMPWTEDAKAVDEEFISFVQSYKTKNRPVVLDLLNKHTDKEIHFFKNRGDAEAFLCNL